MMMLYKHGVCLIGFWLLTSILAFGQLKLKDVKLSVSGSITVVDIKPVRESKYMNQPTEYDVEYGAYSFYSNYYTPRFSLGFSHKLKLFGDNEFRLEHHLGYQQYELNYQSIWYTNIKRDSEGRIYDVLSHSGESVVKHHIGFLKETLKVGLTDKIFCGLSLQTSVLVDIENFGNGHPLYVGGFWTKDNKLRKHRRVYPTAGLSLGFQPFKNVQLSAYSMYGLVGAINATPKEVWITKEIGVSLSVQLPNFFQ